LNIEDEFTGDLAEKIEKQLGKRDVGLLQGFCLKAVCRKK
jgi:hypothetical protein